MGVPCGSPVPPLWVDPGLIHQDGGMTVRWVVVGPGRIASKVVGDAPLVPNAEFVAVASRSAERAQAFALLPGTSRSGATSSTS